IGEKGDTSQTGDRGHQQLQLLCHDLVHGAGQTCCIAARASEPRDQALCHRIDGVRHDNGNIRVCLAHWKNCGTEAADDDVDFESCEVCREVAKSLVSPFCMTNFDSEIPALDIAQSAHPLQKAGVSSWLRQHRTCTARDVADAPNLA